MCNPAFSTPSLIKLQSCRQARVRTVLRISCIPGPPDLAFSPLSLVTEHYSPPSANIHIHSITLSQTVREDEKRIPIGIQRQRKTGRQCSPCDDSLLTGHADPCTLPCMRQTHAPSKQKILIIPASNKLITGINIF